MSFFLSLFVLILNGDLSGIISIIGLLEDLGIIFKANFFSFLNSSEFLIESSELDLSVFSEFSESLFIEDELDSFILKNNNTLSKDFIFAMKDSVLLLEVFNVQAFQDNGDLGLGLIRGNLDVIEARVEDIFLDEFIAQHGQINRFVDLFVDVKIFISSQIRLGGLELFEDFFDLLDGELRKEKELADNSLDLFLSSGFFSINGFSFLAEESEKDNKSFFNEDQGSVTVSAEFSGDPVVGNCDLIADFFLRDVFTEIASELDEVIVESGD